MIAVQEGQLDMVKLLVASKADLEANQDGRTALTEAVTSAQAQVTSFLISKGANVKVRDIEGKSLMAYATYDGKNAAFRKKSQAVLKILKEAGAD